MVAILFGRGVLFVLELKHGLDIAFDKLEVFGFFIGLKRVAKNFASCFSFRNE